MMAAPGRDTARDQNDPWGLGDTTALGPPTADDASSCETPPRATRKPVTPDVVPFGELPLRPAENVLEPPVEPRTSSAVDAATAGAPLAAATGEATEPRRDIVTPVMWQRQAWLADAPTLAGATDDGARIGRADRGPRRLAIAAGLLSLLAVGSGGYVWLTGGGAIGGAGLFVLSSHPPGAQVLVDGVTAGVTPVALRLAPGTHSIVATGADGTVERLSAAVDPGTSVARHLNLEGQTAPSGTRADPELATPTGAPLGPPSAMMSEVAAPPLPGFVTFVVPFNVQIYEGGDFLGTSGERLRIRPGMHTFTLVNQDLGYRSEDTVVVGGGRSTRRVVESRSASLSVNAEPWAEVVVSGRNYGETPLANITLPIGTHQVTLRHPTLGARDVPVTVRLGVPNRLAVDLRR